MKNPFSLFLLLAISISVTQAQSRPVPAATFGFRAGINSSGFKLKDFSEGTETKRNIELVSGVFANFPITEKFSIQPELHYSIMGGEITQPDSATINQKLSYLSVPLQAKFKASKSFSILVGPQFDFLTSANTKTDEQSKSNKDDIVKNDFALTAGVEYEPVSKFLVSARYIHGLKNVPRDQVDGSYFNRGFQLTVGIRLGNQHSESKPKPTPTVVHINPDEDKDGVDDLDDKCPLVAGLVKYSGCPAPDTDRDGINDEEDQCPDKAGIATYHGCPIPDTDKDGINDEQDKCPSIAGIEQYNGCPVPDKDADGITDEVDQCPDVAGTTANRGCPVIISEAFNTNDIQFLYGSITLTPKAKTVLDKGVALLQATEYSKLKVQIAGYTDNRGKQTSNKRISQERADVVKAYLVSKGVDASRITAIGYGSESPRADNSTPAGRSKNRRVEFKISQ